MVKSDSAGETVDVEVGVDPDDRVVRLELQRWKDSADLAGFEP